jgi:hypothetical protein
MSQMWKNEAEIFLKSLGIEHQNKLDYAFLTEKLL